MDLTLHHVHLVANDVPTVCEFYIHNFGAEIVFDEAIAGDRNVFLKIGTGRIHLFESRKAVPPGRNAFHHLGMMVDNLDATVERLRANGVQVGKITRTGPGGGFAMALAPDHVQIELFEVHQPKARKPFVDMPDVVMDVTLHHFHLVTHNVPAFCDFYIRNFGAEIVFDRAIAGDRNVFLKIGSGRIHLFESRTAAPAGRNAFHHLGMMVGDLDATVERLRANGVQVGEITRTGPGGGFAMALATDHVKIELFQVDAEHRSAFVDGPRNPPQLLDASPTATQVSHNTRRLARL